MLMEFTSPRFMLHIRLGMLNARGPQDLLVYLLTRQGRVESSNYRTVKVPSDVELPAFAQPQGAPPVFEKIGIVGREIRSGYSGFIFLTGTAR